jgi:hypothetical protein
MDACKSAGVTGKCSHVQCKVSEKTGQTLDKVNPGQIDFPMLK